MAPNPRTETAAPGRLHRFALRVLGRSKKPVGATKGAKKPIRKKADPAPAPPVLDVALKSPMPLKALHQAMSSKGDLLNLAYDLQRHKGSEKLGTSLLMQTAASGGFTAYAARLAAKLDLGMLASIAPATAAAVLVNHDSALFRALIDHLAAARPPMLGDELTGVLLAILSTGDMKRFEVVRRAYAGDLRRLEAAGDRQYLSILAWLAKQKRLAKHNARQTAKGAVNMALLSYRNPGKSSINVGDYVQSLAMMGQIIQAAGAIPATSASEPFDAECQRVAAHLGVAGKAGNLVLHALDRDEYNLAVCKGPLWLPVFGWHAHPKFGLNNDITFAANARPLFISVHVARPEILTPEFLAVLRRYQPIGCRDYSTVRLLLSNGVRAFFSGCVTSTLGEVFKPQRRGDTQIAASYEAERLEIPEGFEFLAHNDLKLVSSPMSSCMAMAIDFMEKYGTAHEVLTDLLHCYLPNRAIGTPTRFQRKKLGDPRFEGLIGATDEDLAAMRERFAKWREILKLVMAGASENDVRSRWATIWQEEEAATRRYLDACRDALVMPDGAAIASAAAAKVETATLFGNAAAPKDAMHVCFAMDKALIKPFGTTLRTLLNNTQSKIHLHVLTRGLSAEDVMAQVPRKGVASLTQYKFDMVTLESLRLMPHITISTMDRLLLPLVVSATNRIVYLDIDLLIRKDIAPLWKLPLGGHAIAGRPSTERWWKNGINFFYAVASRGQARRASEMRTYLFENGPLFFDCFNAGVLVLDLEKLRQQDFTGRVLSLVTKWGLNDQFVLNIFARGNFKAIPQEWNSFASQEEQRDPGIVHFIGPAKPWNSSRYPIADEWRAEDARGVEKR